MSIRIRVVDGATIAVCAARSVPKPGDIYLDDAAHHALSAKFSLDFSEMFDKPTPYAGSSESALMEREESNNTNRTEWDAWMARCDFPAAEHNTIEGALDCWCDPRFFKPCDECETGCWECEEGRLRLTRQEAEAENGGLVIVHNE